MKLMELLIADSYRGPECRGRPASELFRDITSLAATSNVRIVPIRGTA